MEGKAIMTSTQTTCTLTSACVAELFDRANAEHRACCESAGTALQHAIRAGELLREAKRQCPHGAWQDWLANNFRGSRRTAQVYLRLERNRALFEKRNGDALLSMGQAARLLAKPRQRPGCAAQDREAQHGVDLAGLKLRFAQYWRGASFEKLFAECLRAWKLPTKASDIEELMREIVGLERLFCGINGDEDANAFAQINALCRGYFKLPVTDSRIS